MIISESLVPSASSRFHPKIASEAASHSTTLPSPSITKCAIPSPSKEEVCCGFVAIVWCRRSPDGNPQDVRHMEWPHSNVPEAALWHDASGDDSKPRLLRRVFCNGGFETPACSGPPQIGRSQLTDYLSHR